MKLSKSPVKIDANPSFIRHIIPFQWIIIPTIIDARIKTRAAISEQTIKQHMKGGLHPDL